MTHGSETVSYVPFHALSLLLHSIQVCPDKALLIRLQQEIVQITFNILMSHFLNNIPNGSPELIVVLRKSLKTMLGLVIHLSMGL